MVDATVDPPDGGPALPVPPQVVGIALVSLVVVALLAYGGYLALVERAASRVVIQVCGGVFGLGLVLVAWDGLTDVFERSRP
ncbi:hypothetical protein [Haloarchaeobius sp. HRN-SO-5]|uniref:hypothetical protein n=1 Tax=Haloarchaeobius sp. HRN-SO-5 TaxID=3446118 RepID=UPI003EB9C05E